MPLRDRTGPEGLGPLTGRGAGPCVGSDVFSIAPPASAIWQAGRRPLNRRALAARPAWRRFPRSGRGRNQRFW